MRCWASVLIAVMVCALALCGVADEPFNPFAWEKTTPESSAAYAEAISAMMVNDYEKARPAMEEALKLAPDVYQYHRDYAQILTALGDSEGALAALNQAIALYALEKEPVSEPQMYGDRAALLLASGQFEAALADSDKALAIMPGEAKYYLDRGEAHYYLGHYEEALADFFKAQELSPYDVQAAFCAADTLLTLDRYHESLAQVDRALEFSPDNRVLRAFRVLVVEQSLGVKPRGVGASGFPYFYLAWQDKALPELRLGQMKQDDSEPGFLRDVRTLEGRLVWVDILRDTKELWAYEAQVPVDSPYFADPRQVFLLATDAVLDVGQSNAQVLYDYLLDGLEESSPGVKESGLTYQGQFAMHLKQTEQGQSLRIYPRIPPEVADTLTP